jgi:O-antigen ligase
MLSALMVSLVPLGALAALGGAYSSATLPLLAASVAAFLVSRARIAATAGTRTLDLALAAFLAIVLLQMVPLPQAVAAALSPGASTIQDRLALQPAAAVRPLSIDARLTREGLATAASAVLLFWAARETFARAGVRLFARAVAWSGFAVALVALVQRATAPTLLLWRWKPLDPGAQPYGPFVNRNHFATWLLMATALTAGYLVAHLRSHRLERHASGRLLARDLLADGSMLLLAGSLGAMLLALVGSVSRAALLGLAAALAFAVAHGRRTRHGVPAALGGGLLAMMLGAALWVNREGLLDRLETAGSGPGRLTIWKETMPLVADFWLTGTGVGTYGTAMLHYQVTRPGTLFNQAHNEYLQLVAEGGMLLALAGVMAAWSWVRAARRQLAGERHGLHWIRVGAAAGICAVGVQSVFEAGLRMPANALLLAGLAALVASDGGSGDLSRQER